MKAHVPTPIIAFAVPAAILWLLVVLLAGDPVMNLTRGYVTSTAILVTAMLAVILLGKVACC